MHKCELKNDITIALTSCGRVRLLEKTITSLAQSIDLSLYPKIITEDSKDPKIIKRIRTEENSWFLKGWEVIYTWWSGEESSFASHYKALYRLYNKVDTPYIFHCEDDRFFRNKSFDILVRAKKVLDSQEDIGIICFRDFWKKNIYTLLTPSSVITQQLFLPTKKIYNNTSYYQYGYHEELHSQQSAYNGFTLNPWLRRTQQMKDIMFGYEEVVDEIAIWKRYKACWLRTLNMCPPTCYHTWDHIYSTYFFKDGFRKSLLRGIKNAWALYFKS